MKEFLEQRDVTAQWELDFIDVQFKLGGQPFIGEIKTTGYLSWDEAFRTALGQLLVYAHVRFDRPPAMVMFLDADPGTKRTALATRLGIAVVVEVKEGRYGLLNPTVAPSLGELFGAKKSAD